MAQTLDDKIWNIRSAVEKKLNPGLDPNSNDLDKPSLYWITELYETFAIAAKGKQYFRVDYSIDESGAVTVGELVEVEKTWEPVKGMKLLWFMPIKAAGDWELEVLGVPYGGPKNGKDSDGQYFSQKTNLYLDNFGSPLVVYYHGYEPDGKPSGEPDVIGKAEYFKADNRGHWWRVVLDKASEYAQRVWDAAKKGLAAASSGSLNHLVRVGGDGEILNWPIAELSLFDTEGKRQPANSYAIALPVMKAHFEKAGVEMPEITDVKTSTENDARGAEERGALDADTKQSIKTNNGGNEMDENKVQELIEAALKADKDKREAEAKAAADIQAKVDEAVAKAKGEWEQEAAKANRLPLHMPAVTHLGEIGKFDDLSLAETDLVLSVLAEAKEQPSDGLLKAWAMKAESEADKSRAARQITAAIKASGVKANELDHTTQANYGKEWVGTAYAQQIWEAVRAGTSVLGRIPQVTIPDGYSSEYFPIESTDPTWYKVAEATAEEANTKTPAATHTSSKLKTGSQQLKLAKVGARVQYSGEMVEDSLVPFAAQLQAQLQKSGAEILEHMIIDGDDATTDKTNINDIGATPAGTEPFLVWDGFRCVALGTSGQNRSASGGFAAEDFINTMKLLGTNGIGASNPNECAFIIDANVHYATPQLPEAKDKNQNIFTVQDGFVTRAYGVPVISSWHMHRESTARKANNAGKVDRTVTTNNSYGAIVAVRFDQWKFGWKRRMKMEITRYALADAYEVVANMRCGLIYRDTTAAGITYYVGI